MSKNSNLICFPGSNIAFFGDIINDARGGLNHQNGGDAYLINSKFTGFRSFRIINGFDSSISSTAFNANGPFVRFWNLHTDNDYFNNIPSATLINKDSGRGHFNFEQEVKITNQHTFIHGIIWTPRSKWKQAYVNYETDSTIVIGNNNDNHIDGYAVKSGCTSFEFPIGDGIFQRTAKIISPDCGIYKAAYFKTNSQLGTTGISGEKALTATPNNCMDSIIKVNSTEFWDIDGSQNTYLGLSSLNSSNGYSEWSSDSNFLGCYAEKITITGFNGKWQNLSIVKSPVSLQENGQYDSKLKIVPDSGYSCFTWAAKDTATANLAIKQQTPTNSYNIYIYPNPCTTAFTVKFAGSKDEKVTYFLTNNMGAIVLENDVEINAKQNNIYIEFTILPAGIYFLNICTNNTPFQTKKIIKL